MDRHEEIHKAMDSDYRKPASEVDLTEIWAAVNEIRHVRRNLKSWMRSKKVAPTLALATAEAWSQYEPKGVVLIITPWNFPFSLTISPLVCAIAAGNCAVIKPSELTPMVAELTLKLWQQAGLPAGVINLVQGEVETGKALASHRGIDGLFFTGSSRTGHFIHEQFAGQPGKILAIEMGGNNPLIVKDVADTKAVVHDIIQSAFISSGQRCTCARKLFLPQGEQGDLILSQLIAATKAIKVGFYDDQEQPFMGSMISIAAAKSMVAAQSQLIELGATSLVELVHTENTGFVSPGILECTKVSDFPDDEHFGPLLKVFRYTDFDQAIELGNDTAYGLSAGLLSDNSEDYDYFLRRVRAGIVNWNRPITGASSAAPFGGIGHSGLGREGGHYALEFHSDLKTLQILEGSCD